MAESKLIIETELSTKNFEKQIEALKTKLANDEKELARITGLQAKGVFRGDYGTKSIEKLNVSIEKTKNQLVSLQSQQEKVAEMGEEVGERSSLGFEKGLRSLKRFGMALLGVRGAFTLVRRATSSYLNEHEETANKINSIWVVLGNALGPIIEVIADGILKLIGYLNVFLQALGFDVDLTKNMGKAKNAVQDTTKAMKELNKEVYSFDEMNKSQKETSIGTGDSGTAIGGFEMPELNEDVVNFLQNIAGTLKENWHWLAMILALIGGIKIVNWLTGLAGILGNNSTGLLGIKSALGWLLTIGLIAIEIKLITNFLEEMNNLKKINEGVADFTEQVANEGKQVNDTNRKVASSYEKGSKEIEKYVKSLKNQLDTSKQVIEAKKKDAEQNGLLEDIMDGLSGKTEKNTRIMEANTREIINVAQNLQELAKEGKLTDEQMKVYTEAMEYLNEVQKENSSRIEKAKEPWLAMTYLISDTELEIYDEIKALQQSDNQLSNSTQTQKSLFESIYDVAKSTFGNIDKLQANPKIKTQVDMSNAKELLNALKGNAMFGTVATSTLNLFKQYGLASGGIVYNPGKGVSLSNVIVGEATNGAEGVIPMNNAESMDMIGQSIAKHVVINLTNNTLLDNRVIAREQKQISNDIDFVTNGRGA